MNGIKKYKLIGIDSNLFIYHFEENPQFVSATQLVFNHLSDGNLKAATSIISVIEILSYPLPPKILKQIEESFQLVPNLTVYDVDGAIAKEAAKIRRKHGFRLPDAIQLATAKKAKADIFITNDRSLRQFKSLKVILITELDFL